jgi:hypothetical protein
MAQEEINRIKSIFSEMEICPVYIEHGMVNNSEDSAKIGNFDIGQGVKAIVFTDGNNSWVVVNISADKK